MNLPVIRLISFAENKMYKINIRTKYLYIAEVVDVDNFLLQPTHSTVVV